MIIITDFTCEYRDWAAGAVTGFYGSTQIISRGVLHNVLEMDGFVAVENNFPIGIITYIRSEKNWEIIALISEQKGKGTGTALIRNICDRALLSGAQGVFIAVTNDNLEALGFLQKRGFRLTELDVNAAMGYRSFNPDLPLTGCHRIPVRDELLLEFQFSDSRDSEKICCADDPGRKVFLQELLSRNGMVLYYDHPEQTPVVSLINRIKKEKSMLLYNNEAYNLYRCAEAVSDLPGDFAELGVFQGASARLLCEIKQQKTLHLFDTFSGIPDTGGMDQGFFRGQFSFAGAGVADYLKEFSGVEIHQGLFPGSAVSVSSRVFSFVHLDADTYQSTKDGLEFFYPRLTDGGVILIHDYLAARGVTEAVREFGARGFEVSSRQFLIVKSGK